MRLCTWLAGIDLDSRFLTATLAFSSGSEAPRVLGNQTVEIATDAWQLPNYHELMRESISQFGEWFHLESGGALTSVALAVPGVAIETVPSSGERHFTSPAFVDASVIDQARQQAFQRQRPVGMVLKSEVRGYQLDGRLHDTAPVGTYATSLRVELASWIAKRDFVDPVVKAIETSGFEAGLIASRAEASAETVLTPTERREGAVVVSVGDIDSEIAVLIDSSVADLFTVPLGRAPLVHELARACNVSAGVIDRLDLSLMLDRAPSDPMVQRVRTVLSAWGTALFTGIRRRLDDRNLTRRLGAGIVVAHSAQSLPLLDDSAARLLGVPARYASASAAVRSNKGAMQNSFASIGLIALEWKARLAQTGQNSSRDRPPVTMTAVEPFREPAKGGIGQALGRWLREFVPADNH